MMINLAQQTPPCLPPHICQVAQMMISLRKQNNDIKKKSQYASKTYNSGPILSVCILFCFSRSVLIRNISVLICNWRIICVPFLNLPSQTQSCPLENQSQNRPWDLEPET